MTVDDGGGVCVCGGGVTSGEDVISSSRRPKSHGAGPKSPSPRSRRPLSPRLGLFIITLFQSVSADALKRPLPPPPISPCLFTPFDTRFIPADGLFTVGDPCAARASREAKGRRRSLLCDIAKKKQIKNGSGTLLVQCRITEGY